MPTPPKQPKEVSLDEIEVPRYVTEHHLMGQDKEKILESLKDINVQKVIWNQIVLKIAGYKDEDDAKSAMSELKAYVNLLPRPTVKPQTSVPPRTVS